jgi:hypothetical protein
MENSSIDESFYAERSEDGVGHSLLDPAHFCRNWQKLKSLDDPSRVGPGLSMLRAG